MAIEPKRKIPIGIELVRRGIVTESDIQRAIEYQRSNPRKKNRRHSSHIRFM